MRDNDYKLWMKLMKLDEKLAQTLFTPDDFTKMTKIVGKIRTMMSNDNIWPHLRHGPNLEATSHWVEQIKWIGTPTCVLFPRFTFLLTVVHQRTEFIARRSHASADENAWIALSANSERCSIRQCSYFKGNDAAFDC